jgi:hypothetical protein
MGGGPVAGVMVFVVDRWACEAMPGTDCVFANGLVVQRFDARATI